MLNEIFDPNKLQKLMNNTNTTYKDIKNVMITLFQLHLS